MSGAPVAARAGMGLSFGPPPPGDPLLTDIVWRAAALPAQTSAAAATAAAASGDHWLNPHLPPVRRTRAAAVLLALGSDADGALSLLFTMRAAHLADHAGQVALPGGKIEPGELPFEAALREGEEECALPRSALVPIGATEPYVTRTGFCVVPVIAALKRPVDVVGDPNEVAAVFTAPWRHVMDAANHGRVEMERDGRVHTFFEIFYGEQRIWGVTAGILRLVAERVGAP